MTGGDNVYIYESIRLGSGYPLVFNAVLHNIIKVRDRSLNVYFPTLD